MKKYLIRPSGLGTLISKSGKMTQVVEKKIKELFICHTRLVKKDINSKYFDKGIACEQDGVDMLQKVFYPNRKTPIMTFKKLISNNELEGTPDVFVDQKDLIDIKNAYDLFTFDNAQLSWEYEWQMKGYMYLLGITESKLFYCLCDMPDFLMAKEERDLLYKGEFISAETEEYQNAIVELHKKYDYSNMHLSERFKVFDVSLTSVDIDIIRKTSTIVNNEFQKLKELQDALIEINLHIIENSKNNL